MYTSTVDVNNTVLTPRNSILPYESMTQTMHFHSIPSTHARPCSPRHDDALRPLRPSRRRSPAPAGALATALLLLFSISAAAPTLASASALPRPNPLAQPRPQSAAAAAAPGNNIVDPSLSVPALQWRKLAIAPNSPVPGPRRDAVFVYEHAFKKIILFGGRTRDNVPQDDTWVLDLYSATWTPVDYNPARPLRPPARYGAIAGSDLPTTSDRQGVIVGLGMGVNGQVLSDVWGFHLTQMKWAPIPASGTAPALANAVSGVSPEEHNQPPYSTTLLSSLGSGADGKPSTASYALSISGVAANYNYSTVTAAWSKLDMGSTTPAARADVAGTVMPGQKVLAFGGCSAERCPRADAWLATPQGASRMSGGQGSWKQVDTCPAPRRGAAVASRPDIAAGKYQNQAVMFGGVVSSGSGSASDEDVKDGVVAYFDGDSSSWAHVLPAPAPGADTPYPSQRAGAAMTSHYESGATVMFGGQLADGATTNDVWILQFNAPNAQNKYIGCSTAARDEAESGLGSSGARPGAGINEPLPAAFMTSGLALIVFGALVARFLKPVPTPKHQQRQGGGRLRTNSFPAPPRTPPPASIPTPQLPPISSLRGQSTSPGPGTHQPNALVPQLSPTIPSHHMNLDATQMAAAPTKPNRTCAQSWLWIHILTSLIGSGLLVAGFWLAYIATIPASFDPSSSTSYKLIISPHSVTSLTLLVLLALVTITSLFHPYFFPSLSIDQSTAQARRQSAIQAAAAAASAHQTAAMQGALRDANVADPSVYVAASQHHAKRAAMAKLAANGGKSGNGAGAAVKGPLPRLRAYVLASRGGYAGVYRRAHQAMGTVAVLVGVVNVYVGLIEANAGWLWYAGVGVVNAGVFLLVAVLTLMGRPSKKSRMVKWARRVTGVSAPASPRGPAAAAAAAGRASAPVEDPGLVAAAAALAALPPLSAGAGMRRSVAGTDTSGYDDSYVYGDDEESGGGPGTVSGSSWTSDEDGGYYGGNAMAVAATPGSSDYNSGSESPRRYHARQQRRRSARPYEVDPADEGTFPRPSQRQGMTGTEEDEDDFELDGPGQERVGGDMYDREVVMISVPKARLRIVN